MTETSSNSGCSPRLGMCEVCAANEARYACPKCEVKTCCLPCVQIHKKELACDGQRDRTKFVPLSQMTAREFMSDYCFLEEATRYAEARKTDRSKRFTHDNSNNRGLSVPQHRLRTAAYWRNIRLELQLPNFTRHKENTTYLDWKQRRLFWRVEWIFVNIPLEEENDGQAEPVARFVDARCDEHETLAKLALKYVDLQQETALNHRKRLAHHQTAGIGQLSFWLRAEGVPRSATRCYALEAATPLGKNLAGKTIVEFPTIYVTYEPKPPLGLEAIESDDLELEEETSASPPAAKKAKKEHLLEEEILASKDRSKRVTHNKGNNSRLSAPSQHRLRKAAYWRNVRLQLQQPNCSRHIENTTCLDWKLGRLFWRVEWMFVNTPMEEVNDCQIQPITRFADARCDEHDTLQNLILKYVDLQQETAQDHRQCLVRHQTAGIGQLSFWLRAETVQDRATRCYALEATTSLGKNLAGKTIIEFPTIFVTYEPKPPVGLEAIESGADNLDLEEETFAFASDEEEEIDVFHGIATAFSSDDDSEPEPKPEEEPEDEDEGDDDDEDDLAFEESYTEQGDA